MHSNTPNTLSPNGIELIKQHEGCRLQAYLCPANRLTIGYGHVLLPKWDHRLFQRVSADSLARMVDECQHLRIVTHEARVCLRINQEQAQQLLERDTNQTSLFLSSVTRVALNQHQFDALVSLIINIGQGNYARSTLRKKLHAGDSASAAAEFDRWVMATVDGKKQRLPGLIARRADERALFEQGDDHEQ